MPYHPPFTLTARLIDLVSRISEGLGRWAGEEAGISPRLRRENRIRSIHEIEFIHPFSDGNGRIGRLWQTAVLARWKPQLAFLPVETVVHDRQAEYYKALAASDAQADVAPFAEFILHALMEAVSVGSDPVSDPVKRLLSVMMPTDTMGVQDLMSRLKLVHKTNFRRNYLQPALDAGVLAMTQPDSPHSPTQRYRLTEKGRKLLSSHQGI